MIVVTKYDKQKGWTIFRFFEIAEEVGTMNATIQNGECDIYTITSYKKGTGTKMIQYLQEIGAKTISGVADPDSIPFWNTFNPTWNDQDFTITCRKHKGGVVNETNM